MELRVDTNETTRNTELSDVESSNMSSNIDLGEGAGMPDREIELADAGVLGQDSNTGLVTRISSGATEIDMSHTGHSNVSSNPDLRAGTGVLASRFVPAIVRVRAEVRAVDEKSYTPQKVPVGPYHLNRSSRSIEHEKRCAVRFLQRLSQGRHSHSGGALTHHLLEKLELEARGYYRDGICRSIAQEQFLTMLLHDGCYLLGCTVEYNNYLTGNSSSGSTSGPPASSSGETAPSAQTGKVTNWSEDDVVVRDTVFLVENQIPFIVLEAIHEHVTGKPVLEEFEASVRKQLGNLLYISPRAPQRLPEAPSSLLHLVHTYFESHKPPTDRPKTEHRRLLFRRRTRNDDVESAVQQTEESTARPVAPDVESGVGRWRRAMEYYRYGDVSFKRRDFVDDVEWTLLDVRLQGGTLWIPRLQIHGTTWTILRNLMALEEHTAQRPVTAYCVFMSQVACKAEDVELLQRAEIIEQFLGNDEQVVQGFAGLCKGVVFDVDELDRNYLKPMWHELHKRCNYRRNCMGSFRHKYLSQPLHILAFVATALLFSFQLMQVVLTGLSLRQSKP